MNPIIRPAGTADIDPICALLHEQMNPKITRARWRALMTYGWLADKPDLGRVVEAEGRILGYVGMVYSDRAAGGRRERIVNICAWYLDKALRGRGLGTAIMADATADPAMSYDIMTSSKRTLDIVAEVGYRALDDHRWVWRRGPGQALDIDRAVTSIRSAVSAEEQRLLDDHAGLPVTPVLARADGRQCLLMLSIKRKAGDILWVDVLHADDRAFLAVHGQAIADALLTEDGALFAADCRFAIGTPPGAMRERLPVARFFKTARLSPPDIDHLYTELQLLDLKLE